MFFTKDEYKNFIPAVFVREQCHTAENADAPYEDRIAAVAEIRKAAFAHTIAAEAASAGMWTPEQDQYEAPADLYTVAAQLFLRAARLEQLLAKSIDDPPSDQVFRDRTDSALAFMSAQHQAIASAVSGGVQDLSEVQGGDAVLREISTCIIESLRSAGRPNLAALATLRERVQGLETDPEGAPEQALFVAVADTVVSSLQDIGLFFENGAEFVLADVSETLANCSMLMGAYGRAEVANLLDQYVRQLSWLQENSVWRLPSELGLSGALGDALGEELVTLLIGEGKAFLFPSQWEAIRHHGVGGGTAESLVSMPTGSGKSLLAELTIIRHLHEWTASGQRKASRAFFVVPTRALAREKMTELRDMFSHLRSLNASVCQLTGDLLLNAENAIASYDVIVATPEKFDMIVREPDLRTQIGVVVVDEFHNINRGARGLRLLSLLSRIRYGGDMGGVKMHLVSAIVKPDDLDFVNEWLSDGGRGRALTFRSDRHSLFTRCGIFNYAAQRQSPIWRIEYDDGTSVSIDAPPPLRKTWGVRQHSRAADKLALALSGEGPVMLFATSARWRYGGGRMNCPPIDKAIDLADEIAEMPSWVDPEANRRLVAGLRRLWGESRLVTAAQKGVTAHWGGLPLRGRRLVEKAVSEKGVAILVSTSTLAEGVNMPLRRLILPKCTIRGNVFEVGFFLNLKGRAGRPFLTEEGEVIVVASQDTPLNLAERLCAVSAKDVEDLRSPLVALRQMEEDDARDIQDALDTAALAIVAEEMPRNDVLTDEIMTRVTLRRESEESEVGSEVAGHVRGSLGRLHGWELIEQQDDRTTVTSFGVAVYKSGFAPSDAVRTRRDGEANGEFQRLDSELPSTPRDGRSYGALVLVMEMMSRTRHWEQVRNVGNFSVRQAALFLNDWVRGSTLSEISSERERSRLYLHSAIAGVLAPTAAWFLISLSAWVEGGRFDTGTPSLSVRLGRWAEYMWFGVPPGVTLRLMQSDFEGRWYRDDAIGVCRVLGTSVVGRILDGRSRLTEEQLVKTIRAGMPQSVEAAETLARSLLNRARSG